MFSTNEHRIRQVCGAITPEGATSDTDSFGSATSGLFLVWLRSGVQKLQQDINTCFEPNYHPIAFLPSTPTSSLCLSRPSHHLASLVMPDEDILSGDRMAAAAVGQYLALCYALLVYVAFSDDVICHSKHIYRGVDANFRLPRRSESGKFQHH
jgi:hypothetical protein